MISSGYTSKRRMARLVHNYSAGKPSGMGPRCVLLSLVGLAGCFVPPPLELEPDGAVPTSAPVIFGDQVTPKLGDTVTVRQTAPGASTSNKTQFVLKVWDPDSSKLYTRVFIDGDFTEVVEEKEALGCNIVTPKGDKGCFAGHTLAGLCDETVNFALGPHVLEIYISDTEWADNDPEDLRKTPFGAFRDNVWWRVNCIEPVESDAGI
jgi:hypothetical protein